MLFDKCDMARTTGGATVMMWMMWMMTLLVFLVVIYDEVLV
jgi:hypothetical protein